MSQDGARASRIGLGIASPLAGFSAGLAAGLLVALPAARARTAAPEAAQAAAPRADPRAFPLSALGKLNVVTGPGSRQHCTATLIGPRHVLTAAHCLYDRARQTWVDPRGVHFVAGYASGAYTAHAVARAYTKSDGYSFGTGRDSFARDWAIVELAEDIPLRPLRISRATGDAGRSWSGLMHAGYRVSTSQVLTVETGCGVRLDPGVGPNMAPILGGGCRTAPGESGSALIDLSEGEPTVVGVLVAATGIPEKSSLAVPASAFLPTAEVALQTVR